MIEALREDLGIMCPMIFAAKGAKRVVGRVAVAYFFEAQYAHIL